MKEYLITVGYFSAGAAYIFGCAALFATGVQGTIHDSRTPLINWSMIIASVFGAILFIVAVTGAGSAP